MFIDQYFLQPHHRLHQQTEFLWYTIGSIQCYLARNYSDPELTVEKTSRDTHIPVSRVSEILKSVSGIGFRSYLNKIRLNEAKRLLSESQKRISEIGYSVGYSNISHFNRTFKKIVGLSPGEYRQTQKK